jgi:hypothetical protein
LDAWCRLPAARQFLWSTRLSFSIGRRAVLGQDRMIERLRAMSFQLETPDGH